MSAYSISVRNIIESDFPSIVDYFLGGDTDFLLGMGVDLSKLPTREAWLNILRAEYVKPMHEKNFFYVIWEVNNKPIGHSNINKIIVNQEAYMHLHMWRRDTRNSGLGFELMKLTLPYFFDLFFLKNLYCEPYALNPAPNKMMKKLGFDLLKTYETVPGWINSYQLVNKWCLSFEKYKMMYKD